MNATLRAEMPAGFTWTQPEGGMFLWITGPEKLDGMQLLTQAIEHKVAFVPGRDFFPGHEGANCLRLNFSNSTPEKIREGVKRLGMLCRELGR
jgi:2-aminoadipate transaminase